MGELARSASFVFLLPFLEDGREVTVWKWVRGGVSRRNSLSEKPPTSANVQVSKGCVGRRGYASSSILWSIHCASFKFIASCSCASLLSPAAPLCAANPLSE